ncbi:hypothetical protein AGMMS49921_00600 [Endomicrobiia bacterium]|nr:hypothetical protein AGMMS49921_00600 [Endomicrobiia bacterium]
MANQWLDCIMGKIEEEDLLIGARKGKIGAFCGFSANKSEYKTGSDVGIDMFAMSTMAGAGTIMEVVGKELHWERLGNMEMVIAKHIVIQKSDR